MLRVMSGGIVMGVLFAASPAWSEETTEPSGVSPPPAVAPEPALEWAKLVSEFETAVQRYIRLIEFTQRIEAERAQREFDEAAARYAKFEAFTQKLAEEREQLLELEFEVMVALHLRKQAFTDELVAERERAGARVGTPSK